jgi:hypothetical protein
MPKYFFAMPSVLSGAARVLDFMGVFDYYTVGRTPAETDALAIYSDWRSVGDDFATVIGSDPEMYDVEQEEP